MKKMYKTAIETLKINNSESVFIDDNIDNCIGAEKLGIRTVLMSRDNYFENKEKYKNRIIIKDLYELEKFLKDN